MYLDELPKVFARTLSALQRLISESVPAQLANVPTMAKLIIYEENSENIVSNEL